MIKRMIYAAAALAGMLAASTSCVRTDLPDADVADDGYVEIRFDADIPAMPVVDTRSVDPDGTGVQNMTLFCFDSYGLFVSTTKASVTTTTDDMDRGTFTAKVPRNTRLIHFLCNQNMEGFPESDFYNQSEAQVMASLEGSSGMMIYWARFACEADDDRSIADQLGEQGSIELVRNHALISVDAPRDNEYFEATGFVVCNTNAFGTVAPYHPEEGFVWPGTEPFVTLPKNTSVMSDILDVTTDMQQYVFECENTADRPVSVILRGHNIGEGEDKDLYYRVMLIGQDGEQLLIRRNHHYKLHIEGALSYGQASFGDALEAAATNNVWISIQDNIDEVSDNTYTLKVDRTSYVLDQSNAGKIFQIGYTIRRNDETPVTADDAAAVTWLAGNNVAGQSIEHTFDVGEDGTGSGEIGISLRNMGDNEKLEGTLLVKKGLLQRKIKVILIKTQSFQPAWVASQVYGTPGSDGTTYGEHVTLMFTVPETCPAELFPLRVLIGVEDLDVRAAAGISLPVVRRGEADFGENIYNDKGEPIEYKFVYTAQQPGVQRVYFRTILPQSGTGAKTKVSIEAEHFATQEKEVTYTDDRYMIEVFGLDEYDADSGNPDGFADDEAIYYRLVPQKKGAFVQFTMHLHDNTTVASGNEYGDFVNAKEEDEFLIYSQFLDHIPDEEEPEGITFDCTFQPVNEDRWTENGRMYLFYPRWGAQTPAGGNGVYSIYLKTNRPQSAEVVRIASNIEGEKSLKNPEADYKGRGYRSTSFELANYNPFRFAATVDGKGEFSTGSDEEPVTELEWEYRNPDETNVYLEFDVTSFRGSDDKSVDPFGEEFEIRIDAPMLEIDRTKLEECHLTPDKLKADPAVEGRFIYTVAASREEEREFGFTTAHTTDTSPELPSQDGERKRLPFKVNHVVSAGDITLSSNEDQVVFFQKTFRVTNKSIEGEISYNPGTGEPRPVPRNAFVSFTQTNTGSRVGSMTITADGRYELRLRKEYDPGWYDRIELHYTKDGTVYHNEVDENNPLTLARLVQSPDLVLVPATEERSGR